MGQPKYHICEVVTPKEIGISEELLLQQHAEKIEVRTVGDATFLLLNISFVKQHFPYAPLPYCPLILNPRHPLSEYMTFRELQARSTNTEDLEFVLSHLTPDQKAMYEGNSWVRSLGDGDWLLRRKFGVQAS
ncbi:hypothetical protein [Ectobacillus sp. sgz5001026]|uniref:hypothetical protein n=1 Tax=Ectobacillus sp. sgz5001026 TaxID=3242473 RepID=UPI0036D2B96F